MKRVGATLRSGLLAVLLLIAGAAQAQPRSLDMKPGARVHLDRGLRLYAKGDYERASREFQAGYAIEPRPEFLFAAGQSERKGGDCSKATDFYRQYLKTGPPPKDAVAVGAVLEECAKQLAAKAAAPAPPAPAPAPAPLPQIADEPAPVAPAPVEPPHVEVRASPPPPTPSADEGFARLHFSAMLLGDVVSTQGSAELGAALALAPQLDLGAAAGIGDSVGARALLTLHPRRDEASRMSWLVQLRFLYQPVKDGEGVGAGALLAAALEAGRGRLLWGVAGDFFSGPDR